jgi:hypothetical protein
MLDLSWSNERYDGYWTQQGEVTDDPKGSDLQQMRLSLGYAHRLSSRWQTSVVLPYVWNDNRYANFESTSQGLGDAMLGLTYEAFDGIQCVFEVNDWKDLIPATYVGLNLTLPTGISPYDDEDNSFDVTGLGFYRLDAHVLFDKTIYPWTVKTSLAYWIHFERPVNREYGQAVDPYDKKLGDRLTLGLGFAYSKILPQTWTLTTSLDFQYLKQDEETFDGHVDPSTGYTVQSITPALSLHSPTKKWVTKMSYRHIPRSSSWGENFPITETLTLGVSYVLR